MADNWRFSWSGPVTNGLESLRLETRYASWLCLRGGRGILRRARIWPAKDPEVRVVPRARRPAYADRTRLARIRFRVKIFESTTGYLLAQGAVYAPVVVGSADGCAAGLVGAAMAGAPVCDGIVWPMVCVLSAATTCAPRPTVVRECGTVVDRHKPTSASTITNETA